MARPAREGRSKLRPYITIQPATHSAPHDLRARHEIVNAAAVGTKIKQESATQNISPSSGMNSIRVGRNRAHQERAHGAARLLVLHADNAQAQQQLADGLAAHAEQRDLHHGQQAEQRQGLAVGRDEDGG